MKKFAFLASLAVISANILGMNSVNIPLKNGQQDTPLNQINSDFQPFDFLSLGPDMMVDQDFSAEMPANLLPSQTNLNLQPCSSLNPAPDQNFLTDLNFPSYNTSSPASDQNSLFDMHMRSMQ